MSTGALCQFCATEVITVPRSGAGLRSRVEAAGIEPASADAPGGASTSLGCLSLHPAAGDSRPTAGLAILWCRASGDWLSLGAEPVSDAATRATGRARSDALRYRLGSESECG